MDWGEPAIPTSVSAVHRGKLFYRNQDAIELARSATLEEAAVLLWDGPRLPVFSGESVKAGTDPFAMLAALAPNSQPILGRISDHLAQDAATIIGALASACGAAEGTDPLHARLAIGWGCDMQGTGRLRQALVAMADHDLNASTFAARVAASTGASLPACLLAGLCTLSGPRHGGAGEALRYLAADARQHGATKAVTQWLEHDRLLPGFGHTLYPDGDPRAGMMLEGLDPSADLQALAASVLDLTGLHPNCDYALAAMTEALSWPLDAPFRIFLVGRAVGWCAHVMEQNQEGTLIRPRGRYTGTLPD